jgi:hypothetical protein
LSRDIFLAHLERADQFRVAQSFLDGIEVFALEIFDEREFQHFAVVSVAEDDRNLLQARQLGGPPAAFASDEFESVALLANDQRLNDALFLDGIGEFLQGFRREIFAGLKRARLHAVQRRPSARDPARRRPLEQRRRRRWSERRQEEALVLRMELSRPATLPARDPKLVLPLREE